MAFLVNAESQERFPISKGESVIGRGPYLRVKELSLSRSHALLSYNDGKLSIKSTHKNPTFFYSSTTSSDKENELVVLKKNDWKELVDGDKISLLVDSYSYLVEIKQPDEEGKQSPDDDVGADSIDKNEKEIISSPVEINEKLKNNDRENLDSTKYEDQTQMSIDSMENENQSTTSSPKKRTLPSWMSDSGTSPQKKKVNRETDASQINDTSPKKDEKNSEELSAQTNLVDELQDDEAQCSTSAGNNNNSPSQCSSFADININEDGEESKEEKQEPSKKCPYGKKCYRKNPMHFEEFSHPGENDNEDENEERSGVDGEKTECPYGMKCYRQNNPHHATKHTHTSIGKERTSRRKRKTRTKKGKSLLDKDEDADGENEYDMNDSFLASSDESSGYSDDPNDSDYAPQSGKEDADEEEEDLDELVAEAKGFIKNKKM